MINYSLYIWHFHYIQFCIQNNLLTTSLIRPRTYIHINFENPWMIASLFVYSICMIACNNILYMHNSCTTGTSCIFSLFQLLIRINFVINFQIQQNVYYVNFNFSMSVPKSNVKIPLVELISSSNQMNKGHESLNIKPIKASLI